MTYTFLHLGVVIGESTLSSKTFEPGHRSGDLLPTSYGRKILPTVTCMLSSKLAFEKQLAVKGQTAKNWNQRQLARFMNKTAAGRALMDAERILKDVELRGPNESKIEFSEIAFCDLAEFHRVNSILGYELDPAFQNPPPENPEFTVSVMLRHAWRSKTQAGPVFQGAPGRRIMN